MVSETTLDLPNESERQQTRLHRRLSMTAQPRAFVGLEHEAADMKNESGAAEREGKRKYGGEVHIKHRSKFMFTYKTEYLQITHTQPTSQQPAAILVQNTAAKSRLCEQQKNRTALERWAAACSAIEKSRNYTSMYVPEQ